MQKFIIIKSDGQKEFFEPQKLADSLKRAGAEDELISKIVKHVEGELTDGMSTTDIYHHAFSFLRRHAEESGKQEHKPLAARYSLRRALVGLGPTGFPFEEYVAEIFKAQGYETENDKVLMGRCVEHEVDVVAWNDKKLLVCEVKFHNELGLKSDSKVALYVKARIDDLRQNLFFYGGRERSIDEGWLITNTKFTEHAMIYGKCVGMKMLGWNYPAQSEGESLEVMIEKYKLHPVSCLATLGNVEKQQLYARKIVLCKSLIEDSSVLESLGLSQSKIDDIKKEILSLAM